MKNSIDLHIHSRYSDDGEFSPIELVEKCVESGIHTMSITDHNSIRANAEAFEAATQKGIRYIPGIEIDCVFQDVNLHILGYGIDYLSNDFYEIEKNIDNQSTAVSLKMLELTQSLGFEITEHDLKNVSKNSHKQGVWTGEMFAEVLLSHPAYENHPLLLPYRSEGARSKNPFVNFYWDYYSQEGPCYVKLNYPSLEDAVKIIHENGGKAVLAHPHANIQGNDELLRRILAMGINGIEAFTSYHTPSQAFHFLREAQRANVFVTCGSDYHGKTKPSISIGRHGCFITESELMSISKELLHSD